MSGLGERTAENGLGAALRQLLEARETVSGWRSTPADPAAYDGIFDRIAPGVDEARKRLAAERKDAVARWQALEGHPQTRRLVRVRNDRRFQTWGFHQFLLKRSRHLADTHPREALEMADLALAVAKALSPAEHGEERIADLRAAAWTAIADARNRLGDSDSAWDALHCAEEALEEGSGDPLDKAELEQLRARFLKALGQDEEAERAARRAAYLLRRVGDRRPEEPGHPEVHGRAARG
ncbi:MAG TPA: hypothetical protein VHC97_20955 [Thermoanaerobaculia bacterium]|jgi:tetratricopeptide (TPR) repeat protein|nr:hypothetical protein [Thermoanaerobaculia bacterium]